MIRVEGRALIIPDEERVIGYVDDNKIETREFYVTEAQLFEFSFKLDVESADGRDIIDLAKKQADGGIVLLWEVLWETLQKAGVLHVQLRAFSESGEVWHSEVTDFTVRRSIYDTKDFVKMQPTEFEEIERRATFAKEAAELSASEAEGSANDAKHEAENAEKARELAFQYANNVLKSAADAEARARDAEASYEAAKQSEGNAKAFEEAALRHSLSAQDAETFAQDAAKAAKNSVDFANSEAYRAEDAASRAETAAGRAEKAQGEAVPAKEAAVNAKGSAEESARIAKESELNAELSRIAAKQSELAAETSRTAAKQSELAADARAEYAWEAEKQATASAERAEAAVRDAKKELNATKFANALKGNKRGEVIRIRDVSPIEHELVVKIESQNILDLSKVVPISSASSVTVDGSSVIIPATNKYGFSVGQDAAGFTIGEIYTASIGSITDYEANNYGWRLKYTDGTYQSNVSNTLTYTFTPLKEVESLYFYVGLPYNGGQEVIASDVQIVKGSVATRYTPYVENVGAAKLIANDTVYAVDGDGTVRGVKSVYPSMTLATDTEGLVIECEYNRDISKAFVKRGELERIASVTVAPDTDGSLPSRVIFDKDIDGNNFELSSLYVKINGGLSGTTASNFYANVNDQAIVGNVNVGLKQQQLRKFMFVFKKQHDDSMHAFATHSSTAPTFWNAQAPTTGNIFIPPQDAIQFKAIKKIELFPYNANWCEGTTFELWGVRV